MKKRLHIQVTGIVQGVGFRPFVYNLARERNLSGFVGNDSEGVFIEVQGKTDDLASFRDTLRHNPPPLSYIEDVTVEEVAPVKFNGFHIQPSVKGEAMSTFVSPDMAVCAECAAELDDPLDRRYLYPFLNCTNCGPRYSIISSVPYDRPNTSMHTFEMCPECRAEYEHPADRRFHAQPNACPHCGPSVTLSTSQGEVLQKSEYAIVLTNKLLKHGHIVAIKGLGGFHLACNAHSRRAVERLRQRKNREEKPLAVMVKDIATAEKYIILSEQEKRLLTSGQAPIVLAEKRPTQEMHDQIAPGNPRLGIMLPYTPLHKLLFHSSLDMLVMTSGNYTDEPICIDNDDARERLREIADYMLMHNRDILQRVDDSVAVVLRDKPRIIRRSRGYVPRPVKLLHRTEPLLAVGGELKNTLGYSRDDTAFISQHIGDLTNVRAMDFFHHTRNHLKSILEVEPGLIACDLHPRYLATQWAADQTGIATLGVQHHHAHLASVMAENRLSDPVIGLIMDGTGYGMDGTVWGGEVLIGDYSSFRRFAHFENIPLPGGDKAIKEPWRMGVSYLLHTFGENYQRYIPSDWKQFPVAQIKQMIEKKINTPLTSSCGRLFDGIAALCGGRTHISYEAQAAVEFQHRMKPATLRPLSYEISRVNGHYEVVIAPIVKDAVELLKAGAELSEISFRFHQMLVEVFLDLAERARRETGLERVALSGGIFQNTYLFEHVTQHLEGKGFHIFTHARVPTNDGGISVGQLAVAQALIRAGNQQADYQYQ